MSELEEVLKKVEDKLILSSKVYAALNYQIWIVIMAGYYLLIGIVPSNYLLLTAIYWSVGFIIYFIASGIIIKKMKMLRLNEKESKSDMWSIIISWSIASIMGWFIVPYSLTSIGWEYLAALGVGLLSFIAIANIGMIVSLKIIYDRYEYEMYPGAFIPLILMIPVYFVKVDPMYYAGMGVVVSYGLTVILYLYSVFKYSG